MAINQGGTNVATGQGFQFGNPGNIQSLEQRNLEAAKIKNAKKLRAKELLKKGLSKAAATRIIVQEFKLTRDPFAGTAPWMKEAADEVIAEGGKITPGTIDTGGKERADKKRKQVTGKAATNFEARLKRDKTKTGLGKAYETAHMGNIFQAKKLGASYPVDALSNQPENINQKLAENLNDELKPLYKKQLDLRKKAKKSNNKMLISAIDKNNFQINELVSSGGKQGKAAVNILRGWNVDPKTLKPYLPEIGYNTLKSVDRGMSGLTTNQVKAKTAEDVVIRMNNLETIKDLYKKEPKGSPFRKFIDKRVNCADGCFIKVANKNPERIAKKLSEDQKLIRLFRGESFPQRNIKSLKERGKFFGTSLAEMKKDTLSGQWFTPNQAHASSYLSRPGQMKYVDVTPAELESFNRYKAKVNKRPVKYSVKKQSGLPGAPTHGVTPSEFHQIIPRYKLKQMEEAGRLKTKYDLNPFGKGTRDDRLVKSVKGVLEYDDVLGGFVDARNPGEIVGQNQLKTWAADNPIDVKVGTEIPKPTKSVLKTVGKTLAHIGAPLPTALIDGYFINKQMDEGKSTAEIAKDPLNWLGLATMEPLTKMAGANAPGGLNAVLRLGLNPGIIRGITRFAGLPGLAISTAMTAYDQYKKYQNEEGFVYNLFNKEGT